MDYLLNTEEYALNSLWKMQEVLNLIINGLPSKLKRDTTIRKVSLSFKPYYKWITF